jgi:hypothetical protein
MKSERQKREEEIERLLRGETRSAEPDADFQEKLRRAASAIILEEQRRTEETERAKSRKLSLTPQSAGLSVVVLGAGLSWWMPGVGAALVVCGIAVILWANIAKWLKH